MPKKRTILTQLSQLPGTLPGREREQLEQEKPEYWTGAAFESRLVRNTLDYLGNRDSAKEYLGHDAGTLHELYRFMTDMEREPAFEEMGEVWKERFNTVSRILGLQRKVKKSEGEQ